MIKTSPKTSSPTFFSFGILPFVVGGFTDSINPCALTTIVFFVIFLLFFLKYRKAMIIFGGCFILGVLGTIFFLTMGLADPLRSSSLFFLVCRMIYLILALIALGVGTLSLRDWWVYKKTKSADSSILNFSRISQRLDPLLLKISNNWKNALWFPWVFLAAGALTALVMSISPEQTYISLTVYTMNIAQERMNSVLYLFLYSLCFVFPLVFSFVFVALSSQWKAWPAITQRYGTGIRIVCAAVFFAIGLGLLYAFL